MAFPDDCPCIHESPVHCPCETVEEIEISDEDFKKIVKNLIEKTGDTIQ